MKMNENKQTNKGTCFALEVDKQDSTNHQEGYRRQNEEEKRNQNWITDQLRELAAHRNQQISTRLARSPNLGTLSLSCGFTSFSSVFFNSCDDFRFVFHSVATFCLSFARSADCLRLLGSLVLLLGLALCSASPSRLRHHWNFLTTLQTMFQCCWCSKICWCNYYWKRPRRSELCSLSFAVSVTGLFLAQISLIHFIPVCFICVLFLRSVRGRSAWCWSNMTR